MIVNPCRYIAVIYKDMQERTTSYRREMTEQDLAELKREAGEGNTLAIFKLETIVNGR